ncbi:MAG: ATP synthase F1 subunit delta [Prevotellaceae bacterium]|jgi:F-type H+-transporting ATPase subunit delta|nr:ATP synthase F1 subunit delta [Prevotellaceae bacterium]
MERGVIARRYAQALWLYATERSSEDEVYAQTLALVSVFSGYPALRRVLESRRVAVQKKEEMIAALLKNEGQSSSVVQRFVQVLVKNNREEFLREICLSFQNIYRREKKLLNVSLTTAAPLQKQVQQAVGKKIESATGKKVSFSNEVDLSIGGGYILRWGTYRIDASVAGRLKQLRKKMLER